MSDDVRVGDIVRTCDRSGRVRRVVIQAVMHKRPGVAQYLVNFGGPNHGGLNTAVRQRHEITVIDDVGDGEKSQDSP